MTDPNALSAPYQGSKTFSSVLRKIEVSVQYAVYAPGQFGLSFSGQDPTGGTKYIYAYQIFNTIYSSSGFVNRLSVGLALGSEQASDIGYIDDGDGGTYTVRPSGTGSLPAYSFDTGTAGWNFYDPDIVYSTTENTSDVVFFASPFGPRPPESWGYGTVSGAGSKMLTLPGPMPEPTTLAILTAGFVLTLRRGRKNLTAAASRG